MSALTKIKAAIEQLPASDLRHLNAWIADLCWGEWDREIEEDAKAGRLDKLVEQAMAEVSAGKCKPLCCQGVAAPSLRDRRPFDAGGLVQTIRNEDSLLRDRAEVDRRSADSDPNHWLKPEDFEQRLEDLLRARMAQAKTGDMSPQSVSDIWAEVRDWRTR